MATKTVTAVEAFGKVSESAEQIKNGEPVAIEVMSPGDNVRQGDVYIIMVGKELPKNVGPWAGFQLAPGSTMGSRHIASGQGVTLYTSDEESTTAILNKLVPGTRNEQQFYGPVIVAPHGVTIGHPEHAAKTLPPGNYITTQQRTGRETLRRTAD